MGLKWKTATAKQLAEAFGAATEAVKADAFKVLASETTIIKDISVAQAPVDTGELEAAHKVVKRNNGANRATYDVTVGGVVNGVNVDAYAMQIHEGIGWSKLGPKSIAKQAASPGVTVGEKFLQRAFDGRIEKTLAAIMAAITGGMAKNVG